MNLSRQVLRKIDDTLRAEFDQEQGEWMAKVPISGATKMVWQRYCQAVGVGMGEGVAILIHPRAGIGRRSGPREARRPAQSPGGGDEDPGPGAQRSGEGPERA